VVPEKYNWGEESEDDRRVDIVYPLPYGVGAPIGAWGQGGGALGVGEPNFFLAEGGGGRVFPQASPVRQGVFGGEQPVQKCGVDRDRFGGVTDRGKSACFSWVDQLFGRPDVVRGGFARESAQ